MRLLMKPSSRRYLAEKDLVFFAKYYLTKHIKTNVPKLHREWYNIVATEKRIAIAAPRSHAKSTIFSLVYPLWCILFKKKKNIVILSDTFTQAQQLLGEIIQELETNQKIIKDFGKIAGYIPPLAEEKSTWTTSNIVTATNIKVMASGWKSGLRGLKFDAQRPDLIILDDVENDVNVQTEEQRLKTSNIFKKSILNLGDQTTQVIVVGTILHFDALLANLIAKPLPNWYTRLYRAIKEDGTSLCPELWTLEQLDIKKNEIGTIAFEQEFLNNPLDPSTQIIKPVAFYENFDSSNCDYFGYIDLAISEKETADYTAIVTIGRHRQTGDMFVVDPVRIRGDVNQQLDLVFQQHLKYSYRVFGVESVAYQKAFWQILQNACVQRGINIPAIEVEIDKDKVRRAIEVTPYIESGKVKFNLNHQDFLMEVQQFPKAAHDDYVDSMVGAISLAVKNGGSGKIHTSTGISYPKNY